MTEYDLQTDKAEPYRDKDILQRLYWNERLTVSEVAEVVECSVSTVTRWMDKLGVDRRGPQQRQIEHQELTDETWLREKYHGEMMSITEVAEEIGCSRMPVYRALKRHGIERHHIDYDRQNTHPGFRIHDQGYVCAFSNHYEGDGEQTFEEVRIHRLLAVSEHGFEAVANKEVHHENGIAWDNRPGNIEILSKDEHAKHHFEQRGGLQPWQGD
jgi:DNA-binding Lrp family transcriptional regulator